jgi:hypothetical protein
MEVTARFTTKRFSSISAKEFFLGSGFLAIALFAERYTPTAQFDFGFFPFLASLILCFITIHTNFWPGRRSIALGGSQQQPQRAIVPSWRSKEASERSEMSTCTDDIGAGAVVLKLSIVLHYNTEQIAQIETVS